MTLVVYFILLFGLVTAIGHSDTTINDVILSHLSKNIDDEHRSFYVVDIEAAIKRVKLWQQSLPRIESHYCVKTNSDPLLIQLYAAYDLGFDCATKVSLKSDTVVYCSWNLYTV